MERVRPLRTEVAALEEEQAALTQRSAALRKEVEKLESSIATYKAEYAALIRDAEGIKMTMKRVTERCERSAALLSSLSSERTRQVLYYTILYAVLCYTILL